MSFILVETTVRMVKLGEGVWVDKDLRDEDKDSDGTPVQMYVDICGHDT